jgi:hypothetical protein
LIIKGNEKRSLPKQGQPTAKAMFFESPSPSYIAKQAPTSQTKASKSGEIADSSPEKPLAKKIESDSSVVTEILKHVPDLTFMLSEELCLP